MKKIQRVGDFGDHFKKINVGLLDRDRGGGIRCIADRKKG